MAVRFDAASDRVSWAGTPPTPSSGLTVTWWMYISVDLDYYASVIRLHANTGNTTVINSALDQDGVTPAIFTVGGTTTGPQAGAVAGWTRVAVTTTGSTGKVYVALGSGGATQSSTGVVGGSGATIPTGYTIGGRAPADASEWYNGRIAYMRIWSSVLTQTEIEAEWVSATPVRTSLLFADYPLPDAGDLLDHSGNGRHLTTGSTSVTTEDGPPIAVTIVGAVGATLPTLTTATAGDVLVAGELDATLPALTIQTAGDVTSNGELAAVLPALSVSVAGVPVLTGELDATLPELAAHAAGAPLVAGQLATALPALSAAVSGYLIAHPGILAMTLPALTMGSGQVTEWPPAVDGPYEIHLVAVS